MNPVQSNPSLFQNAKKKKHKHKEKKEKEKEKREKKGRKRALPTKRQQSSTKSSPPPEYSGEQTKEATNVEVWTNSLPPYVYACAVTSISSP